MAKEFEALRVQVSAVSPARADAWRMPAEKPREEPRDLARTLLRALLVVLLCGVLAPAQSEIYKWTDAQGITHFSDQPPPGGTATQFRMPATHDSGAASTPVADTPAPIPAPAAAQPATKRVLMYGADWCGYCKQARSYFTSHGVPFSEYDVEKDAAAGREFKRLGGNGVPLILVGEQRLQGFSAAGFERLYRQ